jgi:hypothetical protein
LLIEAMLAVVLFGLFTTATFLTLLTGQESSQEGADRIRGIHYAEQAIEIAKAVRDRDFDELTPGEYGFTLNEDGQWALSGSSIERYGYRTFLRIESVADDKIRATARSSWKHGYHRSGATVLSVELTDWRRDAASIGDWSNISSAGGVVVNGSQLFGDIAVDGDYAYVTSDAGGDGLYIFDVSDPESPFRVATTFTPGGAARGPVVYGNTLYVLVDGTGNEIHAYDISDPTALNGSTVPIATYNLPGGADRGVAMARKGATLLVGADGGSGEGNFFTFNIADPNTIDLLDFYEVADDPSVFDIGVKGNYALLATGRDIEELVVMDISSPSALAQHASYNAVDVHDGTAARAYGTGFYLGRAAGTTIDEFLMIIGAGGTPSGAPSDTSGADMGAGGEGTVNDMAIDTLGCYVFLATDSSSKELQIRNARSKDIPEEQYVDLTTDARGVYYDMMADRLYVSTNTGFTIFLPGIGDGCL